MICAVFSKPNQDDCFKIYVLDVYNYDEKRIDEFI